MKKEVFFSILIGALLGFGIVGIIWSQKNAPSKKEGGPAAEASPSLELEETENEKAETEESVLEVTEPQDGSISNKEGITISGKTLPEATVVIVWEEGEDILVADEKGLFEAEITLVGGENLIEVTAYAENGDQETKTITVVYSTAKI